MKSIDDFFYRQYVEGEYDCLDFTVEVWAYLTGQDLRAALGGLLEGAAARAIGRGHRRAFIALDRPEPLCLAFLSRPRLEPHVGVYIDGKVLHIHYEAVEFQPPEVAARLFTRIKYYMPCNE